MPSLLPSLRGLRRSPGFALTAILTLGLGIGLATAVFTVADALLLRRLPVRDQDRVVLLWGEKPDGGFPHAPFGFAGARDFVRRARALERAALVTYEGAWPKPVRDGDRLSRLRVAVVSGEFFDVLGARPLLGRALHAADDVYGAAPALVLSHAAWRQRFAGDPHVLGRRVEMYDDGVAYTVVGVMPPGLEYPRGTEAWVPLLVARSPESLRYAAVDVIARLAPGATLAAARDEVTAFHARPDVSPWERGLRGVVTALPRLVVGDTRPALFAFAAAAALLLLITCLDVANLLLVRGLARVREVAVRSALGAGRGRIVAQLLAENALLALAGGVLGVAVAALAVRAFVAFAPSDLPRLHEIGVNATALAGAVAITAGATLLFALAPAVMTSRADVRQVLRSGTRQSLGRGARLASEALAAAQVALALLVLSAAALVARSLVRLERADLALEPSHLLVAELALRFDQYGDVAAQRALLARLLPAVQAIPGVRAVSPIVAIPFSGNGGWSGRPAAEGQSVEEAAANPVLNMEVVAPGYFAALGVPVLRGRGFTDADREGSLPVVVLSQSAARYYWPGGDPIGKRVRMGGGLEQTLTVVGIVPDTRYRDLREPRPSIYFALRQSFFPFAPTTLAIRASGPPAALVPTVRRVIGETAPGVELASAAPFEAFLARPLAQPRLDALLLAVFALAAVALAAIGLFGVMATMVRQRTREIGVRMALGASAAEVGWLVLRRGLAVAAAGTALGLLGALAANRALASMLFEVSPTDAPTLGAVALLLLVVAALASFVPARAGTRIEPVAALRAE